MQRLWRTGFVLLSVLLATSALAASPAGDVVVQGRRAELVFASDSDTPKLEALFADPPLIPDLKDLHAGVALSLPELSPERAQVVRRLNDAGVPVIAWMALPADEGYYLNASNAGAAEKRFRDFENWTKENGLVWAGVGLDIEPSLGDWAQIQHGRWRLLSTLLERAFDGQRVVRARTAYEKLIREIEAQGYQVGTYQLLFLADQRRVHSTVLERMFGIVDVRGNDEALMVYSSFNHVLDGALVWVYGPDAQTIAVGSTAGSGDPKLDQKFRALNWDEFSRDLIVASHFSRVVGVYSLEGCVRQGFLPKLKNLNWERPVTLSAASVSQARIFRRRVQTVLWTLAHLVYIAIAFLLLVGWSVVWWRKRRRVRQGAFPVAGIAERDARTD